MRKVLQLTVAFVFVILSVTAQDITRAQADSLAGTLSSRVADTTRMTILLKLATFAIHQRRISDTALTTTNAYIREAEQLNKKLKLPFFNEHILLIRSGLYKAQGNAKAGKALLSQVITQLQSKDNKALLGQAYYEM